MDHINSNLRDTMYITIIHITSMVMTYLWDQEHLGLYFRASTVSTILFDQIVRQMICHISLSSQDYQTLCHGVDQLLTHIYSIAYMLKLIINIYKIISRNRHKSVRATHYHDIIVRNSTK